MNSNTALFCFLRRANLEQYVSAFQSQAITVNTLLELDSGEINELAVIVKMPFGHKHDLKKLIRENSTSSSTSSSLTSQGSTLNSAFPSNSQTSIYSTNNTSFPSTSSQLYDSALSFDDSMGEKIKIGNYSSSTI